MGVPGADGYRPCVPSEHQSDRENQPIFVVPHDPDWEDIFKREALLIQDAIGPWVTGGVHHVGSTSVPGLEAKPIVDIAVGVESLAASQPCIELLSRLDYQYWPYQENVMHWFCKPDPARRTHHLHLMPTGSSRMEDELAFRDYLRTHPYRAHEYGRFKRHLVEQHPNDREAYTQAKASFVQTVTDLAHAWLADSPSL